EGPKRATKTGGSADDVHVPPALWYARRTECLMDRENETTRATLFARLRHLLDRVLGSRGRDGESAEDRLRQAEAKYRTLVEQLPLVTYIDALTETASAIYASPQVESLLGYTVEEWVGDPGFFPKILHPDDHDRVL